MIVLEDVPGLQQVVSTRRVTPGPPPGLGGPVRLGSNDLPGLTQQLSAIPPDISAIQTVTTASRPPPAIMDTEEFPALAPSASKNVISIVLPATPKRGLSAASIFKGVANKSGAMKEKSDEPTPATDAPAVEDNLAGVRSAKAAGKVPVSDSSSSRSHTTDTTPKPLPVLIKSLPVEQPRPRAQVLRIASTAASPSKTTETRSKTTSVAPSRAQSPDPAPTSTTVPSTPTAGSFLGKKKPTTTERGEKKSKKAKKKELEMELKDALSRSVDVERDDEMGETGHSPVIGRKKKAKKPGQGSIPASRVVSAAVAKKEGDMTVEDRSAAEAVEDQKTEMANNPSVAEKQKTAASSQRQKAEELAEPVLTSSEVPAKASAFTKAKAKRGTVVTRARQPGLKDEVASLVDKAKRVTSLGSPGQSNVSPAWTAEDEVKAKTLSKMLGIDLLDGNPYVQLGEDILQVVLSNSCSIAKPLSSTSHIRAADGSMLSILGSGLSARPSSRGNIPTITPKAPSWISPADLSADLIRMEIMSEEAQLLFEGKPARRFIGRDNQVIWGKEAYVPTTNSMGLGGRVFRTPGGLVLSNLSAGEEQKVVELEQRLKNAYTKGEFWRGRDGIEKRTATKLVRSMGPKMNEIIEEMLYLELQKLRREEEQEQDDSDAEENRDDDTDDENNGSRGKEDLGPFGMSPALASVVMGITGPRGRGSASGEGFGLRYSDRLGGLSRELVQDPTNFAHQRVEDVMGKFFVGDISSNTETDADDMTPSTLSTAFRASNMTAINDDSDHSDVSDVLDFEENITAFDSRKRAPGMGIRGSLAPRDQYGHVAIKGTESPEEIYRMWLEEKMECEALMTRYNWMTKINGKVLKAALEDVKAGF